MSNVWQTVLLVGAGAAVFKAAGPVVIGGRQLPQRASGLVAALAPALLGALVATQVFGGERALVLDARTSGFAAAVLLILLRAPILLVVVGAAAATAITRATA